MIEYDGNGKLCFIIDTSKKIAQNALQQRSKSDADWNGLTHFALIKAACRVFFLNKGSTSALKSIYDRTLAPVHTFTHIVFTHSPAALSTEAAIRKPSEMWKLPDLKEYCSFIVLNLISVLCTCKGCVIPPNIFFMF